MLFLSLVLRLFCETFWNIWQQTLCFPCKKECLFMLRIYYNICIKSVLLHLSNNRLSTDSLNLKMIFWLKFLQLWPRITITAVWSDQIWFYFPTARINTQKYDDIIIWNRVYVIFLLNIYVIWIEAWIGW